MEEKDEQGIFSLKLADKQPIPGWLGRMADGMANRIFGLSKINDIYLHAKSASTCTRDFLEAVLDYMDIRIDVARAELERIPAKGPVVVVANHPHGAIEGLVLAKLLLEVRPDVKIMANYLLGRIPELRELFMFVDPFSHDAAVEANFGSMRRSIRMVEKGGLLAIFPAGEVAHMSWSRPQVEDQQWNTTAARIAQNAGAPVVPVYFHGANGPFFQAAGLIHPMLRTALLPRQVPKMAGGIIRLRVGTAISPKHLAGFGNAAKRTDYLKWRTYLLKKSAVADKVGSAEGAFEDSYAPKARPKRRRMLVAEVSGLPSGQFVAASGDWKVFYARKEQIPLVMDEIGRLREETFRLAGEGTGQELDLDIFDEYYLQLVLWNQANGEVAGGYRMGLGDEILAAHGKKGLYTASLFRYKAELFKKLDGSFMELGRSFVCPKYQRSYSALMLLWKGIGAFVARNPKYRYLLGTVSVSADYKPASRKLIMRFFETRLASEYANYARPKKPMRLTPKPGSKLSRSTPILENMANVEALSEVIKDLEGGRMGVPILLKQYLKLASRSLGWNVDPEFGNALDCLMLADLLRGDAKTMIRYCGRQGFETFKAYHTDDGNLESRQSA